MSDMLSRVEGILRAGLEGQTYEGPIMSRVEYLLKELIESGGGGGGGGESTIAWKPTVSAAGVISWTRTTSTTKPADQNIKGESGFSPTVTVEPITGGNRITITDESGPHTFDVMDGSGGGDAVLSEELKTTKAVGGIPTNKTYPKNTPLEDLFKDMLNPVQNPTLTGPSASINYSAPDLAYVGQELPAKTAQVVLNRGSINPQYTAESPYRAGPASGYSLSVSGATASFSDSNTTGSFSLPALKRDTKGSIVLSATVNYGQGVQPKNSIGQNYSAPLAAGSVSGTKTIQFILPFRHGVVADPNAIDLNALTMDVTTKSDKTYSFDTNDEYMVVAYDSTYGDLTKITDPNGFDGTDGFEKKIIGEYNVYVAKSPTIDTGAVYTFSF